MQSLRSQYHFNVQFIFRRASDAIVLQVALFLPFEGTELRTSAWIQMEFDTERVRCNAAHQGRHASGCRATEPYYFNDTLSWAIAAKPACRANRDNFVWGKSADVWDVRRIAADAHAIKRAAR